MSIRDLVKPHIRDLAPYKPGKPMEELERELGISDAVKLASNENPLGPSPKAVEAIRATAGAIHRYPDGASFKLRSPPALLAFARRTRRRESRPAARGASERDGPPGSEVVVG